MAKRSVGEGLKVRIASRSNRVALGAWIATTRISSHRNRGFFF